MNIIIKNALFLACVLCLFISLMAQSSSQKSNPKEEGNMNVVMTVLSVDNDIVSFELYNQGHSASKIETFGVKSKRIKLRFPVYEKFENGKWQKIKIGYCGTGQGLNLLELFPGEKQDVVVDIAILKDLIIFPATIRVKICDEVSLKYITSNEFVIKKL